MEDFKALRKEPKKNALPTGITDGSPVEADVNTIRFGGDCYLKSQVTSSLYRVGRVLVCRDAEETAK